MKARTSHRRRISPSARGRRRVVLNWWRRSGPPPRLSGAELGKRANRSIRSGPAGGRLSNAGRPGASLFCGRSSRLKALRTGRPAASSRRDDIPARTARRTAQLGLSLLLASGRDLHPLCADWVRHPGRSEGVARVAAAGDCRELQTTCRSSTALPANGGCQEYEMPWLPGYEGATGPNRERRGQTAPARRLWRSARRLLRRPPRGSLHQRGDLGVEGALVLHLEKIWREPDEGIWEVRGGAAPLHPFEGDGVGRVRSRGALDRGIRARRTRSSAGETFVHRFTRKSAEHGFDPEQNAFVQSSAPRRWMPASCCSRWSAFCRLRIRASRARSRPSSAGSSATDSCCAITRARPDGRLAARRRRVPRLQLLACRQLCAARTA